MTIYQTIFETKSVYFLVRMNTITRNIANPNTDNKICDIYTVPTPKTALMRDFNLP